MAEPFDVYADRFHVSVNYEAGWITFELNAAHPDTPERAVPTRLGTVRMSRPLLKLLAYRMWEQIMDREGVDGMRIDYPPDVLDQIEVSREMWAAFWSPMED